MGGANLHSTVPRQVILQKPHRFCFKTAIIFLEWYISKGTVKCMHLLAERLKYNIIPE